MRSIQIETTRILLWPYEYWTNTLKKNIKLKIKGDAS